MAKEPPIKIGIDVFVVRPGDKLVVAVNKDYLSEHDADEYARKLESFLPNVEVLVIPAAALAVYREEEP